jgi:hypothetical protein
MNKARSQFQQMSDVGGGRLVEALAVSIAWREPAAR